MTAVPSQPFLGLSYLFSLNSTDAPDPLEHVEMLNPRPVAIIHGHLGPLLKVHLFIQGSPSVHWACDGCPENAPVLGNYVFQHIVVNGVGFQRGRRLCGYYERVTIWLLG